MSKQWTDTELAEWEEALSADTILNAPQTESVYDFTASVALAYAQSHEAHTKAHREAVMQLKTVKLLPSSIVAQTQAGKIQAISDMVQAGLIHGDAAYQMLWEDDEVKLKHVPYHVGMDWASSNTDNIVFTTNSSSSINIVSTPVNMSFDMGDRITYKGRSGSIKACNYFNDEFQILWDDGYATIDHKWYGGDGIEHDTEETSDKDPVPYKVGDRVLCNDGAVKNAPGKIVGYNDPFYMVNLDSGTPNVPFYARELSPLAGSSNTGLNAKCKHLNKRASYVMKFGRKEDFFYCPTCGEEVK